MDHYCLLRIVILSAWLKQNKQSLAAGCCSLSISAQSISIAKSDSHSTMPQVELLASSTYQEQSELLPILAKLVKQYRLNNMPCNLVLQAEDYQLLLIEKLQVKPTELQLALRWRIRELIQFPITDAVIDSFLLPPVPQQNTQHMAVIAAKFSQLQRLTREIRLTGLRLTSIDVPELCLRNIARYYEYEAQGLLLLYCQPNSSQLLILQGGDLYLMRNLDLANDHGATIPSHYARNDSEKNRFDRLTLEIQRSLDYYQHQWRKPLPAQLLVAVTQEQEQIKDHLTQQLTIPIRYIDLAEIGIDTTAQSNAYYIQTLPVLGGALRSDSKNYATRD